MKSGMMSIGNARYAAIAPSTSFCSRGTRESRARSHTKRAYVGSLRAVSTASFTLRGRLNRSATVDLPLRVPCPERLHRCGCGGLAIRRPERDQIVRLSIGHAAQLHRWLRLVRKTGHISERGGHVV